MTQILSVGGASFEFPQRSSWRRQLHGSLRNHGASHGLRSRELCLARDKRWRRILQQGTVQEAKHTSSQSMNNLSTAPRPAPLPELDWKLQWYLPWTERTSQWEVQMTLRHDWRTIPNNKYSRLSLLDCSQNCIILLSWTSWMEMKKMLLMPSNYSVGCKSFSTQNPLQTEWETILGLLTLFMLHHCYTIAQPLHNVHILWHCANYRC